MKIRTAIGLALVALAVGFMLWYLGRPHYRDALCRRHLREICRMSVIYAGDCDEVYPDSLTRLAGFGIDPSALVCPAANIRPGVPRDIDRWSGYTLIPGVSAESDPSGVFVYCPPENHGGRCGHVAFIDGHVETLAPEAFAALLAKRGIAARPEEPSPAP